MSQIPRMSIHAKAQGVVQSIGETLDIADHIVASALIEHAARNAEPARVIASWLERNPQRNTARPARRVAWENVDGDAVLVGEGAPATPGLYRHGPWTLMRLGDSTSSTARAEEGNGWYLEGPGLTTPRYLGPRQSDARREADVTVLAWERHQ